MRLKRRRDFQRVYQGGRVWRGSCFALHVLARDSGVRLGIVVGRRFGNAVSRNRIKRRVREVFRRIAPRLPPADIIVRPDSGSERLTAAEIERALARGVEGALSREVKGWNERRSS